MATSSTNVPLGTRAPEFELPDVVTGEPLRLGDVAGSRVLVVAFICRHCPYVQHVKEELARLGRDYMWRDVAFVAISANDADAYHDDAPESLAEFAGEIGLPYPLLYDESQYVAKAYGAACTPDFFVFDSGRHLVYHGQLDDSRPGSGMPVTGADLRAAIQAVLGGVTPATAQKPSIGCSIKWKSGPATA